MRCGTIYIHDMYVMSYFEGIPTFIMVEPMIYGPHFSMFLEELELSTKFELEL